MITTHKILNQNSSNISSLQDQTVDLIVTSPPYPMIAMWDDIFANQDRNIKIALEQQDGNKAFCLMHQVLNNIWKQCDRVLKDGGIVCINIGDATRSINDNFCMYSNHSKIIDWFVNHNYSLLPDIIWKKQTNSPNKFLGSGMYPVGAYVTYQHEYILIFRKGNKRIFSKEQKILRRESSYFWQERNIWFSDIWSVKGTAQKIKNENIDRRSAAYPFEIPYRLVNMYSIYGDTVLDPFVGLGTTNIACIASNRNSIGIQIDNDFCNVAKQNILSKKDFVNDIIKTRLNNHREYMNDSNSSIENINHNFKVKTKQQTDIKINYISNIYMQNNIIKCHYEDITNMQNS